jgi:hypothetical protein
MARQSIASLTLGFAVLVGLWIFVVPRNPVLPGDLVSSSTWEMVWVVRERDCISCQRATSQLRHLQVVTGLPLHIVYVGGRDIATVEALLARERLRADVRRISVLARYLRFGPRDVPFIVVIDQGRIVQILDMHGHGSEVPPRVI